MKMLEGKVAAVTGAASGLGRAMALAFAGEGMHAALADVDEPGLNSTLNEVQGRGVRAFAMRVDVSRYQEVESFCSKAIAQFGATHVVCNNAGVSPLGAVWENTLADWQWILGVNLWGVIHGVRAFVPRLLAQGEGHVVNTASVAGLISPPGMGAYNVTKHAVVALSESLYHDLRSRGSPVGVEFEPLRPLLARVAQVEYLSDERLDQDPLLPRQFDAGDMMYARAQYALAPTILVHSGGPLPLVLANFASAKGLEQAIAAGRYDVLARSSGNIALLSRR